MTPIRFSESIDKLAPALVEAQAIMDAVPLDSKNPAFRSKYASLTACLYAVQPALRTAKLMLTQHPSYDAEAKVVSVTTMLMHSSGQFMSSTCSLPLGGKKDGHALKSATTYLRRIGIIGILGLPEDDDDGNATSAVQGYSRKQQAAPPKAMPLVTADDIKGYHAQLEGLNIKPATVAAFMRAHGKPPAEKANGEQLFNRLEWVKRNVDTVLRWAEEQQGA